MSNINQNPQNIKSASKNADNCLADNIKFAQQIVIKLNSQSSYPILGVSDHHQKVGKGVVFCAIPGAHFDPRTKISEAIAAGVSAVIYDNSDGFSFDGKHLIPVLAIDKLREVQGFIAHEIYGGVSNKGKIFAVTGTNGKTSITWAMSEILGRLGEKAGVIGTLGYGRVDNLKLTGNTTPSAIFFQQCLYELINKQNCKWVCAEITSIALEQWRTQGTKYFSQSFTNLSRDHLDYHLDMANYFCCKQKLFLDYPAEYAIINLSDDYGQQLWNMRGKFLAKNKVGLVWDDINQKRLINVKNNDEKVIFVSGESAEHFVLHGLQAGKQFTQEFSTPWLGKHNLENLSICAININLAGFSWQQIADAMYDLPMPAGRLQKVEIKNNILKSALPAVYIDYAHTPDGLQKVLQAMQDKRKNGKLWCVFGCGGNRDRGKRPVMGDVAIKLADNVIVTSDNPRNEEPMAIIKDIYPQIINSPKISVIVETDRAMAIAKAIENAKGGDTILIAGKGHEETQEIKDVKYPFSDYEVAQQYLQLCSDKLNSKV